MFQFVFFHTRQNHNLTKNLSSLLAHDENGLARVKSIYLLIDKRLIEWGKITISIYLHLFSGLSIARLTTNLDQGHQAYNCKIRTAWEQQIVQSKGFAWKLTEEWHTDIGKGAIVERSVTFSEKKQWVLFELCVQMSLGIWTSASWKWIYRLVFIDSFMLNCLNKK